MAHPTEPVAAPATPEAPPSPTPETPPLAGSSELPKTGRGGSRPGAGRPPKPKSVNALRTELREARKALREQRTGAADPFAAPVKGAKPAAASSPAQPTSAPEAAPLGEDGARALAPVYYAIVNFGAGMLIKGAPNYKDKPKEVARLLAAVRLDPTTGSADRQAIDPALIPVLAKLRLTPELALIIATGGVLLGKWALATSDADALDLLKHVAPPAEPASPSPQPAAQ